MNEQQYEVLTYDRFGAMVESLAIMVQARFPEVDFIYAPPRGGWPVAVHLSHHLQVPRIIIPNDMAQGKIPWQLKASEQNHLLFVDDIVDRGETLLEFHDQMRRKSANGWNITPLSCSLYYKPHSAIIPNVYVRTVSNNTWVVFPWERRGDAKVQRSEYAQRQSRD